MLPGQQPMTRVPFVSLLELLFSRCWLHAALFSVWNCYNELCYWECQIIIESAKPSDYFDCNWPTGNPTAVNPIVWLYFTVIMDFPYGLQRLLVIDVNIPCSRVSIWIVCAMNVSPVVWLKHYITKPAAYLSVDSSSYKMPNMIGYDWTKSRFHQLCLHTHLVNISSPKQIFSWCERCNFYNIMCKIKHLIHPSRRCWFFWVLCNLMTNHAYSHKLFYLKSIL